MFINCSKTLEVKVDSSYANEGEAADVSELIRSIASTIKECGISQHLKKISIGVITPYSAQERLIKKWIKNMCERINCCRIQNINSSNITLKLGVG